MNTLQEFITIIKASSFIKKKKTVYLDTFLTFDIETTHVPTTEESVMYTWQISCNKPVNGEYPCYIGRTWKEFLDFMDTITEYLQTIKSRMVIYVHNLSYEMCYLTSFIRIEQSLWLSPWSPLTIHTHYNTIEWRDSYKLFNASLETCTKGLPHAKLKGEDFDYTKARYHFTPLTPQEEKYCINDVVGLVESIVKRMHDFGLNGKEDNITTIPLTSTGYVRRETKNRKGTTKLCGMTPNDELYTMLKNAFRGGNTHANARYVGKVLENVVSYDRTSSYPDCLVNRQFPVTEFIPDTFDPKCEPLAYLMTVTYTNIKTKPNVTVPYIAESKCEIIDNSKYNDNGRIVDADKITLTITDIDYHIIENQYTYETCTIEKCFSAHYGYLPKFFVETVCKYYTGKTSLKGVQGMEIEYCKSKELLNSLYGMCVTDIKKDTCIFDYNQETFVYSQGDDMTPVLPYQWGVWCTAHARKALQDGIDMCGSAFVYCDTDSVKAIKDMLPADFDDRMGAFNRVSAFNSDMHGGCALTPKGDKKSMGVFEYEETYTQFVTLGAKKYCYRLEDGLHITVAGVGKECAYQLQDDITNFREGFIFTSCKLTPYRTFRHGKTESVDVIDYLGNMGTVVLQDSVTLCDTDYSTSLEDDYREYTRIVQKW